ncbi:hypothetical protein D3273_07030 [Lichenibacterium minor]|uniref:Uncharacterized protein n=1 Tax=Lichenibacterium minor TaxID=2316528 RepID=A0A4Q2UCD2_9HYPH|nr:hypothetical protein [Lichenibacterium minor]RYC32827.1 hypothetical protein D3273_07030 [Lichenibacterium minor]
MAVELKPVHPPGRLPSPSPATLLIGGARGLRFLVSRRSTSRVAETAQLIAQMRPSVETSSSIHPISGCLPVSDATESSVRRSEVLMLSLLRSALPLALAASLVAVPARAGSVTYQWVITDNFALSGNPVTQLDPSTCTGMSCGPMTPTTFYQGSSATASASVPPTNGSSPSGTYYVGFASPNGNRNECGFTISGGTVNADGSSARPTAYAFINKYTFAGSRLQPGCKYNGLTATPGCSTLNGTCTYTANFSIETYNN